MQREARHISFDFEALCRRVVAVCPGATNINSWNKEEGGFNRVFTFRTDTSKLLVAKMPFSLAGPPRLTTNSEVATMKYCESRIHILIRGRSESLEATNATFLLVQQHSDIPIPSVIDWCDDSSNEIGSEYIIMEHADGVQLNLMWPSMNRSQRIECIKNIYRTIRQIDDLRFPAYGSLYTADAPVNSTTVSLDSQYRIGPHCGVRYWGCNVGEQRFAHNAQPNRGPCRYQSYCYMTFHMLTLSVGADLGNWSSGLIDAGLSRIPPFDNIAPDRPHCFGSVETHVALLETGRLLLKKLSGDTRIHSMATPAIFHPDLHKRNILVSKDDPTNITYFIDWQSASIEPAFWYIDQTPDYGRVPDSETDPADSTMQACAQAFEFSTQFFLPRLASPRSVDINIFRPFQYCYRSWRDGAVAFRHEVIETSKHWSELGLEGPCPISLPSAEELAAHQRDYKLFKAAQTLRDQLVNLLDVSSDGWVPWENFERTKARHIALYEGSLQAIGNQEDPPDDDEPVKNEEDLMKIWPFDL